MRKIFFIVLLQLFAFLLINAGFSFAREITQPAAGILVVGDHSNISMSKKERALRAALSQKRKSLGYDSSTLPILAYNYYLPEVRNYCKDSLMINENDLLFLGIVSLDGKIPKKVLYKMKEPDSDDINKSVDIIFEKIISGNYKDVIKIDDSEKTAPKSRVTKDARERNAKIAAKKSLSHKKSVAAAKTTRQKASSIEEKPIAQTTGTLILMSDPPKAKVFVDGKYMGLSPLRVKNVPAGKHGVSMSVGNIKWGKAVEIAPGKIYTLKGLMDFKTATEAKNPAQAQAKQPDAPRTVKASFNNTPPQEAFVPKFASNDVFSITVSNIEETNMIKNYYKPVPGRKFVVVYLSQANISDETRAYAGEFALVDQGGTSYEYLQKLSMLSVIVLRPGGMRVGYLVFEIPADSKPMTVVLSGMDRAPLSVPLK